MRQESVKLAECKPFPYRDLRIDPVDSEHVERLRVSIRESGFWHGAVLRRNPKGELEIMSGHARILAALTEGITEAHLDVIEYPSEEEAILAYCRYTLFPARNDSWKIGAVASAVKVIVSGLLSDPQGFRKKLSLSSGGVRRALRQLTEGKISPLLIAKIYEGVPCFSLPEVKERLKTLKASGHYSRIIRETCKAAEAAKSE